MSLTIFGKHSCKVMLHLNGTVTSEKLCMTPVSSYLHDLSWMNVQLSPCITQAVSFFKTRYHPGLALTNPFQFLLIQTVNGLPPKCRLLSTVKQFGTTWLRGEQGIDHVLKLQQVIIIVTI